MKNSQIIKIVFFIVISFSFLKAQNVSVGGNFGIGFNSINWRGNSEYGLGLNGTFYLDKRIFTIVYISTELNYNNKHTGDVNNGVSYEYLTPHILLKLKLGNKLKIVPIIGVGPSFLISDEWRQNGKISKLPIIGDEIIGSLIGGLQFQYKLLPKISLTAQLRHNYCFQFEYPYPIINTSSILIGVNLDLF
jgi:hypothetical protein